MKKAILLFIVGAICLFIVPDPSIANEFIPANVSVFFSPKGGCTSAIIKEINNAKSEILVQAYSFTSAPIAQALVSAHKRGVKVEAILDRSQRKEKYTSATFLANSRTIAQHQFVFL